MHLADRLRHRRAERAGARRNDRGRPDLGRQPDRPAGAQAVASPQVGQRPAHRKKELAATSPLSRRSKGHDMERDQASKFINDLLRLMVSRSGSDLFITGDFPPAIKVDGKLTKVSPQPLNASHTMALARAIMNDKQAAEFERTKECNFAISPPGVGRFRVNAFLQQGKV